MQHTQNKKKKKGKLQECLGETVKQKYKLSNYAGVAVRGNIAGMCKKSCIKLVSTWVTMPAVTAPLCLP